MTTRQENFDHVVYIRVSRPFKNDITQAAKAKKMKVADWCRAALEKELGMRPVKFCACGRPWAHSGKHWGYTHVKA